jgi:hypothetical protein
MHSGNYITRFDINILNLLTGCCVSRNIFTSKKAILSVNCINRLMVAVETECVSCEVRTEFLNVTTSQINHKSVFQNYEIYH